MLSRLDLIFASGFSRLRSQTHNRRSELRVADLERLIGSIRRECLDHVVILNEKHLRRVLREYLSYYSEPRTHLGLGKDSPEARTIEPPEAGRVVALPRVGGLHHRYTRRAA